jgi:tRNA(adenine34) deaminase
MKNYMENADLRWMNEALKEAMKAYKEQEIPVGAVIVCQGKIIGRGYNQVEKLKDVTAHAEMLAITAAANHLGGKYLNECELYVTLEPCVMCVGAIRHARLKRIVYGAADKRHILPGRWEQLIPQTSVSRGVLEDTCSQLLNDFFKQLRD